MSSTDSMIAERVLGLLAGRVPLQERHDELSDRVAGRRVLALIGRLGFLEQAGKLFNGSGVLLGQSFRSLRAGRGDLAVRIDGGHRPLVLRVVVVGPVGLVLRAGTFHAFVDRGKDIGLLFEVLVKPES